MNHRLLFFIILITAAPMSLPAGAETVTTYRDIQPVLEQRCVLCHSGDSAPLGLQLDSLDGLLEGSDNGAVVKSGDPAASELIRRLKGISTPRMPMTGPPYLPDDTIALFEQWIAAGLPAGSAEKPETPAPSEQPKSASLEKDIITYADVAPIFARRCAKCHTEQGQMGSAPEGYRLTSYTATLSGADRIRVVPGRPEASELVRRIKGQARPRMPFDGPPYLSKEEIQLIEDWIRAGARNSEGDAAEIPVGARVRLHGTLTDRWSLDGLDLEVDRDTRLDKSPSPGDYVRVRGRVDENGNIIAERIKRR